MNESSPVPADEDGPTDHKPKQQEVVEQVRTEEPQAPFGQDEPNPSVASDATAEELGLEDDPDPGIGGYDNRDPEGDMPRVPGAPETQNDPQSHDAAPGGDGSKQSSSE